MDMKDMVWIRVLARHGPHGRGALVVCLVVVDRGCLANNTSGPWPW